MSSEPPCATLAGHRQLSHPRAGLGTGKQGLFPSSNYKSCFLLSPFFKGGFYKPEAKRQVCFCSRFVTLPVETVTSKCKKKKPTLQKLETDSALGILLPIHQQLTRSCFNFCCFNTCSGPKTLPKIWQHLGKTLLRKQSYPPKCLFQKSA